MRNDAHDEFDNLPSLTPDRRDDLAELDDEPAPRPGARAASVKVPSTGPLWALAGALSFALAGLGWWSLQQINLMEQRLVATQESFARISEEADGRIQDISGKVVAAESNVTSGSEALRLQVRQLENRQLELAKQVQQGASERAELKRQVQQLGADLKSSQSARSELEKRLTALAGEQSALKSAQADGKSAQAAVTKLDSRLNSLNTELQALKKQGNNQAAIRAVEQDLLILRSELDNRPAAPSGNAPTTAEFDAFRAQMTRNINTLQSQVVNLQQQLNAR